MLTARLHAEKFLANAGLSLEAVIAAAPTPKSDESLFLIGSVADGFANEVSDVDLIYVGANVDGGDILLQDAGYDETLQRHSSGIEINIQYWSIAKIRQIIDDYCETIRSIDAPPEVAKIKVFSRSELKVLHGMKSGLLLAGRNPASEIQPQLARLSEYQLLAHISEHFEHREDAIGQTKAGEKHGAALVLRTAMSSLAGAALAAIDVTVVAEKWRPHLLQTNAESLPPTYSDRLIQHLYVDRDREMDAALVEAIGFSDEVIGWAMSTKPQIFQAAAFLSNKMKFVTAYSPAT